MVTRYVRSQDVVFRMVGDEALLVPTKRIVDLQCLFTLNETGRVVWEELAEPRTAEHIAGTLEARFDVERERADADARSFLAALVREGCAREVRKE